MISKITADNNAYAHKLIILIAAAAVILAGLVRYVAQPSFWLDEAVIAVPLRSPSLQTIFVPHEYGQLFPRIYLSAIAFVRELFGYQFWSLRLLPFLSFVIATLLWAKLLAKRTRTHFALALLAGALFIGATFWLDQAIQLKQYTFDVLMAFIPFLIGDGHFKESFVEGKHKWFIILIAKFLWGWHGRQPLVTAGVAPLQILGAYSVVSKLMRRDKSTDDVQWGSRSAGSLMLLLALMLASALVYYPICAGRIVLFAQFHTQILAIEGAIFILSSSTRRKAATVLLLLFGCVVLVHSTREYAQFLRAEPAENLRPMIPLINSQASNSIWVHPCSVAQVRALPDGLPVEQVVLGDENPLPRRGQKTWIIWSHLGNEACVKQLGQVRNQAHSWQVIHERPGRGLALAEF